MRLTLLIPELIWPEPGDAETFAGLACPALATLLARGRRADAARSPNTEKARSSAAAWLPSDNVLRDWRGPMTPSKRTTVTTGGGLRSRSMGSRARISRNFMAQPEMGIAEAFDQTARPRLLQRQAGCAAQHGFRLRREPAVRGVPYEAGGEARGRRNLLAGADQDPAGVAPRRGP